MSNVTATTCLSILILSHVCASREIDVVSEVREWAGEDGLEVEDVREIGKEVGNASKNKCSHLINCFLLYRTILNVLF